ncbi:RHS repeat domain-containing protein [Agromyces silvae]|uniref:RHS repeat domain-containing protein n=1 Tax=Agromyces silvae TaxID=3388266 RepID=UPI00280ACA68|nr:RHS repeat-associated core domain-containing protein [Agromyces protaetiae]
MVHHLRRGRPAVLALLTSVALVAGFATAATAGEREHDAAAVVGDFGIGDGLEGAIDERVGAFRFVVPIAGLQLGWDSRAAGEDRHRLGAGWSWGLDRIQTGGGVQVHLASGGVFAADDTHPSGLAGYGAEDVVFEQTAGTLPGRGGDLPDLPQLSAVVEYAFVLRELGGVATYFSAAGDPVAQLDRFGARTDWAWVDATTHRLAAVVDPHGMVTALDWADPASVVVRPGANLEAGAEGAGAVWRLATDGGRVVASTDASGRRVSFGYARTGSGLVSSISGVSGGLTRVEWRAYPDAVPRVASVTTTDAAGAELSRRTWAPGADGALSSGWPRDAGERAAFGSPDPGFGYRSSLGDGSTWVVSEYSGRHLLTHRSTVASSPSGEHTVHEQALSYPGDGVLDPAALPGDWSRPSEVTATLRDAAGHERTDTETFRFDARGRAIGSAERVAGADPGAIERETTYRLSAAGDVLDETTTTAPGSAAEVTVTHSFEYGPRGELSARTRTEPTAPGEPVLRQDQAWDAAGNLLRGLDGTGFEYDAANRAVAERAADGTATELRYWADGTRRDRTTRHPDGTLETTGFYWDGADLLNDTHDASGTAAYLLGASRHTRTILEAGDAVTTYYGTDRHGNVTDTTDETGRTTRQTAYTDYGVATDPGAARGLQRDPFGYSGEYTDPTGRQHLRARTYDPVSLQFTTRDEADRHNRYAYADLNPIMNVDPTGRASSPDAWHPVVLGLSILCTAVIGVAALAGVPAAFTWGTGLAAAGVLTDAWAFVVSVGALSVQEADRAGTPVNDGARAFFESPITHLSDFVAGAGLVAAATFSINGLPRLARWLRARLPTQYEAELTTFPVEDMRALIADWEEMVGVMRTDPLSTLTPEYDRLLGRTVSSLRHDVLALVANRPVMVQTSLTAPPQPLLVEGRMVRGFRGWLNNEQRIPLEVSAQIYGHAGLAVGLHDRQALASVLLMSVRPVLNLHRAMKDVPVELEVAVAMRDWRLTNLRSHLEVLVGAPRSNFLDAF